MPLQQCETLEKVRMLRHADPFVPFKLVLNDGRQIPIEHRFQFSIAPSGQKLHVAGPPACGTFIPLRDVAEVLHGGV